MPAMNGCSSCNRRQRPGPARLLAWGALVWLLPASALAGEIQGSLVSAKGGEVSTAYKLPNQRIELCRRGASDKCYATYTNANGQFHFDEIPAGTYEIRTEGRSGTASSTITISTSSATKVMLVTD